MGQSGGGRTPVDDVTEKPARFDDWRMIGKLPKVASLLDAQRPLDS
jgi:hypothetical protein